MATGAWVSGLLPTSTEGTRNLTISGFGTPEAVLLFASEATSATNPLTSRYNVGWGIWDGTNQYTSCHHNDDLGTFIGADSIIKSGRIYVNIAGNGASLTDEFTISGTVTDGITITNSAGSSSVNRKCMALFLKGLTGAKVGYLGGAPLSAATHDITSVGFEPHAVFVLGCDDGTVDTLTVHTSFSFGIVHNGSAATTQGLVCMNLDDNGISVDGYSHIISGKVAHDQTDVTTNSQLTAGAFDASGFSLTNSASNNVGVAYLALAFEDQDDFHFAIAEMPTGTGTHAETGFAYQPDWVGMVGADGDTTDTFPAGWVAFADDSAAISFYHYVNDASNWTGGQGFDETNAINKKNHTGSQDALATLSSLDSGGYTLSYSDAPATLDKYLHFSVKTVSSGNISIETPQADLVLSSQPPGVQASGGAAQPYVIMTVNT